VRPFAYIIIVAYHGDKWLPACVNSLRESLREPVRLVLVDNTGNTSLDLLDLSGFDATVLRTPQPMGFAEANNFALLHGGMESEFVCFLNQDTVSRQDWLGVCIEVMRAHESVGAVIPLIENYDGTAWDEAFTSCTRAAPGLYDRVQRGVMADVDDLPRFIEVPEITAAAMVVRTEALLKAGPFDPIYGSYYEDYDLCRRIAAAGYQVGICTRGRVGHYGGSVTTDRTAYLRRARWIARNRVIYSARWHWNNRPLGMLSYSAWRMSRNLARSLLGRSRIPLSAFLGAHRDLAPLLPRLASAKCDRAAWRRYLKKLGWPPMPSGEPAAAPEALAAET